MHSTSTTTTTQISTSMVTEPWISMIPTNGNCNQTPFFSSRLPKTRIPHAPRKENCKKAPFLSTLNCSQASESFFCNYTRIPPIPRKGICNKDPFLSFESFFHPLRLDTRILQIPRKGNCRKTPFLESINCCHTSETFSHCVKSDARNCESSISSLTTNDILETAKSNVADRLECLVSEFKSLSESIDRVKRLLNYAATLPAFDESSRLESNRVLGCTTQVWLEVKMDDFGLMRFRADSDSEITKGFCSCLIWLLDKAEPEEVLALQPEYLADVNVGLTITARSRINTWHNVLISMQKRTKDLVEERDRNQLPPLEPLPPSIVASDGTNGNANYPRAQKRCLPAIKLGVKEPVNAQEKKIGVTVSFYRGPTLHTILTAAQNSWPSISLCNFAIRSDSEAREAKAGC